MGIIILILPRKEQWAEESIQIRDFKVIFVMTYSSEIIALSSTWAGCSFLPLVTVAPLFVLLGLSEASWDLMNSATRCTRILR